MALLQMANKALVTYWLQLIPRPSTYKSYPEEKVTFVFLYIYTLVSYAHYKLSPAQGYRAPRATNTHNS